MTSKNLFFKLLKEDTKRRLWAVALIWLTFFFIFPIGIALRRESGDINSLPIADQIMEWVTIGNELVSIVMVIAALVFGVIGFSYLHSRQKIDFYHSLPIKRQKLFWTFYTNGIFMVAVAYLVNLAAGLGVAQIKWGIAGQLLMPALETYGFHIVFFILLYSSAVLAMILTGNLVIGILGTGILNLYFPVLLTIISGYYFTWFRTAYIGEMRLLEEWAGRLSPLTIYVNYSNILHEKLSIFTVGVIMPAVLAAVVITILASFLYTKRDSEAAGKAMAFSRSKVVIKLLLTVLGSMICTLLFWKLRATTGWAIFGLICGLVLSHCVIEMLYHFDFKKLFANKRHMAICGLISMAVFCGFRYDLLGYDTYVPKESQIESVSVNLGMESWVDYGNIGRSNDRSLPMWQHEGSDEYIFEHTELKNIQPVLKIANAGVEKAEKDRTNPEVWEYGVKEETGVYDTSVAIEYRLKNGSKVQRSYRIPLSMVLDQFKEMYRDPEYLKGIYPLLSQTGEDTALVRYSDGVEDTVIIKKGTPEMAQEIETLLTTYQEELTALSIDTRMEEEPVANLQFLTTVMDEAIEELRRGAADQYSTSANIAGRGYYPVYPSFEKTIALLGKHGILVDQTSEKSSARQVSIKYYTDGNMREYMNADGILLALPEEIPGIMKDAVPAEYADLNEFNRIYDDNVYMEVTLGEGLRSREEGYVIRPQDLPERIRAQIDADKYEQTIN